MGTLFDLIIDNFMLISIFGALLVLFKIFLVGRNKGFDPADIIISFFRFYNRYDMEMTTKEYKRRYMLINNNLNYVIYVWAVIFLTVVFVNRMVG
jgi:hypothetical protein